MAQAVVLFDGVCNLCTWAVQFIIKHDPEGYFRFASLQSEYGQSLLRAHGVSITLDGRDDTVALVEDGRVYTHSDASLRIARHLTGPVRLAAVLIVLPRFMRDAVYRLVARSRYRVFGRQDVCWMPTPELKARFLDQP
jgi:predicted DCC family thiol-disulfide oxidoreductase YuxK